MVMERSFRTSEEASATEEVTQPMASAKNFQDEVRQWFTGMSSEERAAALGFEDDALMMAALLANAKAPAPSCTSSRSQNTQNAGCADQHSAPRHQHAAPISPFPPKRMTDTLVFSDTFDWEARIALEIIEKTWQEIMMVGEPNTSGVNRRDFVKNSREQDAQKKESNLDKMDEKSKSKTGCAFVEQGNTGNNSIDHSTCRQSDKNGKKTASDAYRIPNEGVATGGKPTLRTVDTGGASGVLKSFEPGEDEKGTMEMNNISAGANECHTMGTNGESSNVHDDPSGFATNTTHATATKISPTSSSALNGIKADTHYPSDINNSRRISEVMDNTRCIFPASSKFASSATTEDQIKSHELQHFQQRKHPFITLSPSYLDSVSGDELLVAFDEIMAMACTDSSLDDPYSFVLPEEATSASWMDLVRTYATIDNSTNQSVPLYMIVLCRFQYSLAKAYPGRSAKSSPTKDESSSNEPNAFQSTSQWLSVLMKRIREAKAKESIEIEKVLSRLAAKLPHVERQITNVDQKSDLENYLLLPFRVLTENLENDSKNTKETADALREIDASIEECLIEDSLLKDSPSKTESAIDDNAVNLDDAIAGTETKIESSTNNPTNPTSSSTKKKRKKNKKKKRKGSNASNATQAKSSVVDKTIEIDPIENVALEEIAASAPAEEENTTNPVLEKEVATVEKPEDKNDKSETEEMAVTELRLTEPSFSGNTKTAMSKIEVVEEEKKPNEDETDNSKEKVEIQNTRTVASGAVLVSESEVGDKGARSSSKEELVNETQNPSNDDDQEDQWETVEVRPRGRKKGMDKHSRLGSQHQINSGNANGHHGANSKKKAPRTKEARARTKTRKMVREILGGVLDAVEETVRRRRNASRERAHMLRNATVASSGNNPTPLNGKNNATGALPQNSQAGTGSSLRDILLRGKASNQNQQVRNGTNANATPLTYSERAKALMNSDLKDDKKNIIRRKNEKPSHITGTKTTKALKAARASPADQNTIPTIASTNSAFTPSVTNVTSRKPGATQSTDSSSSDSFESKKAGNNLSDAAKFVSPSPPLPTLLSPGNNNSTSSSVASSLDAPHAGHHGNKSQSENDVGCHLLNVCERLSREIDVFMKRRETALTIRRHERGLVLAALEKTLGLIWQGKPTVEMYGSCATNLDLPSSDLDVVVCGLDRPYADLIPSPASSSATSNSPRYPQKAGKDDKKRDDPLTNVDNHKDAHNFRPDQRYSQHQMTPYQMQMMYGHMSVNAERVLRLAMELEHQPWAVHVKAIPTASVPVIKILADPARLQGVMNGNADWLVQQPMNGQTPPTMSPEARPGNQAHLPHYQAQRASPLWRGADVVNGLLKVDITFEGPEHGGIGSTKFSKKVVEDFSKETELSPESTPQVQVLMVLKELLAQRRSNEPFSGGLSSYALLLLVISMIGERKIIREELDKTERQRRVVAAGGGNSAIRSSQVAAVPSVKEADAEPSQKNDDEEANSSKPATAEQKYSQVVSQKSETSAKTPVKSKDTIKETVWKDKAAKAEQPKPSKPSGTAVVPVTSTQKPSAPSSWANIARSKASSSSLSTSDKNPDKIEKEKEAKTDPKANKTKDQNIPRKPSSFADAVAKGKALPPTPVVQTPKKVITTKKKEGSGRFDGLLDPPSSKANKKAEKEEHASPKNLQQKQNTEKSESSKIPKTVPAATINKSTEQKSSSTDVNLDSSPDSSGFPQGFHDVIEVLCSGDTTPGKLLMHFLLFYGQHFESQSTAIDYSGTHQRDAANNNGYSVRSSYMTRRNAGSYDPVTGMYTVDPIVVYDPLEGAENNNVARSCFAWSSIRWVFAQSYMTLSSAAEQNATEGSSKRGNGTASEGPAYGHDESGNVVVDPSSPLLELLLSY